MMKKVYHKQNEQGNIVVECFPSTEKAYYEEMRHYLLDGYEQLILDTDMAMTIVRVFLEKGGKIEDVELSEAVYQETDPHYEPVQSPWFKQIFGQRSSEEEAEKHHAEYRIRLSEKIEETRRVQQKVRNAIGDVNRYPRLLQPAIQMPLVDFHQQYRSIKLSLNGNVLVFRPNGVFQTDAEELEEILMDELRTYFILNDFLYD